MKYVFMTVFCSLFLFLSGFTSSVWGHTDITPEMAKAMLDSNDQLIVIDVREVNEFCDEVGHIPSAVNYSWNSGVLQERYHEFPMDAKILFICQSGSRSNHAAEFLNNKGFLNVYDVVGGMLRWKWETEICYSFCPSEIILGSDSDSLITLRQLRNEVLMKDDLGELLTILYYIHAREVSRLLLINPDFREQSITILEQLISETKPMLAGKKIAIERETIYALLILLDKFTGQASPELKATIREIRNGITEGVILKRFVINITE